LTAEERDSINAVTSLLVEEAAAEMEAEQLLEQVEGTLAGLMKGEGDQALPLIAAQKALDFIQTPPAPEPQFTVEQEGPVVPVEEPVVVVMPAAHQFVTSNTGPAINFMTSSSVLFEEESTAAFTDPAIVSSQLKSPVAVVVEEVETVAKVPAVEPALVEPTPQQQPFQQSGSRRSSHRGGRGGYRGGFRNSVTNATDGQQQSFRGGRGGRGGSWRGGSRRNSTAAKQQPQQQLQQ
jgi:hypothetical protein